MRKYDAAKCDPFNPELKRLALAEALIDYFERGRELREILDDVYEFAFEHGCAVNY